MREGLYEDKFGLSGFILHSLATEKELRNTLEAAFMDKFAFTPVENKFEFVKIRSADGITGEVLKDFCGSRGPTYIRSTTDLIALLTNRNLLKQEDPNSYYPTLDELDDFYGEPIEEATTITTTQSSNMVFAEPVSSMIAFDTPVPTTNVLPSQCHKCSMKMLAFIPSLRLQMSLTLYLHINAQYVKKCMSKLI